MRAFKRRGKKEEKGLMSDGISRHARTQRERAERERERNTKSVRGVNFRFCQFEKQKANARRKELTATARHAEHSASIFKAALVRATL
jgi:hypothetical protein